MFAASLALLIGCAGGSNQFTGPNNPGSTNAASTAPVVVITSPSNGATMASPVTISATASGSHPISGMQAFLDNSQIASSSSSSLNAEISPAPGPHSLLIKATDNAGKSGQNSLNFSVTSNAPVVTISSPSSGATVSAPVTIKASAGGSGNITGMQAFIDNVQVASSSSSTLNAQISPAPGQHLLMVQAQDAAGATGQHSLNFSVASPTHQTSTIFYVALQGAVGPCDSYMPCAGMLSAYKYQISNGAFAAQPEATQLIGGDFSQPLALRADNQHQTLFQLNSTGRNVSGGVSIYSIADANGGLKQLTYQQLNPIQQDLNGLVPSGTLFLTLSTDYMGDPGIYSVYEGSDGWVQSGELTAQRDWNATADPLGRFLFTVGNSPNNDGSTVIFTFAIESDGHSLTFSHSTSVPSGTTIAAISPNGQFLYAIENNNGPQADVYQINSDGSLQLFDTEPLPAANLIFHPLGDYAIVYQQSSPSSGSSGPSTLSVYSVQENGYLLTNCSSCGPTIPGPIASANFDSSGNYLFIASAGQLYVFQLDRSSGGVLRQLYGTPFQVGTTDQPNAAAIVPATFTQ